MARRLITLLVIASFAGFVLAGCGGDDKSSSADTTATTTTSETTTPTSTETTSTTETSATTTETSSSSDFANAANCQEFAKIGAQISGALTGSGDVGAVKDAFDKLAAAAPDDIKADFETLGEYIGQVADALQGYDPSSGQAPSADALAKLQSIDSAAATQASQNIATWTQENCTG